MAPRERETRIVKQSSSTAGARSGRGPQVKRRTTKLNRRDTRTHGIDEEFPEDYMCGAEDETVVEDSREEMGGREDGMRIEVDDEDMKEQNTVEFQEHDAFETPPPSNKGKGKARAGHDIKEDKEPTFRLMDLPAEIRLEIYRACLTRPYKILLSKAPQSQLQSTFEELKTARNEEERTFSSFVEEIEDDEERQSVATALRTARNRQSRLRNARRGHFRRMMHIRGLSENRAPTSNTMDTASSTNSRSCTTGSISRKSSSSTRTNPASPSDPLVVNILRTSKQVYKEARSILYSENIFDVSISSAVLSLAALHQRSRRHIKHIELEVPTYSDILERFSEIVRLSLRYCTGLRKFVVYTTFSLPRADGTSNTTVYANGFDILRWLPQQCEVVLRGTRNAEIEAVVEKHRMLAREQDKVAYARRQLISSDSSTTVG